VNQSSFQKYAAILDSNKENQITKYSIKEFEVRIKRRSYLNKNAV